MKKHFDKASVLTTVVPILVLILGVSLTWLFYNQRSLSSTQIAQSEFSISAHGRVANIKSSINSNFEVLLALAAFYNSSDSIDREKFKTFTAPFLNRYTTIQALEWVPRVTHNTREPLTMKAKEWVEDFEFKEKNKSGRLVIAPNKELYYPVYYVEPLAGNLEVIGFDLSSSTARNESLTKAEKTKKPVVTSRINLVQDDSEQYGILILIPIFNGRDANTVDSLSGFVLGVYKVGDIVKESLQGHSTQDYRLVITDIRGRPEILASYPDAGAGAGADYIQAKFTHKEKIKVADREWEITVQPTQNFFVNHLSKSSDIIFIIGVTLSMLACMCARLLLSQSSQVKALVHQKTNELQKSSNHIKAIINTVIDGIIAIDSEGKVLSLNPAVERIFGYTEPEILGKNVKMLMPEPYHSNHDGYIKSYLTGQGNKIIGVGGREVTGLRKDGSTFPMELSVSEMDSYGERHFIGIVRDITERKKLEGVKSEFVSTVSHELRTPLTSIKGSVSLVLNKYSDTLSDKALKMLKLAERNIERLSYLINDLLDLEKIDSGKLQLTLKEVDLINLCKQTLSDSEHFASQNDIELKFISDLSDANIHADEGRIIQVLTNLISNAVKFSPSGSTAEVSVQKNADYYRVSVKDHGYGIKPEFQGKLFERFSQADSSDTKVQSGSGLGLCISKSIVEMHQGNIGFETSAGVGTTFYVDLMQLSTKVNHQSKVAGNPSADRVFNILHIEDEPDTLLLINELLSDRANISQAKTISSALGLLSKEKYDLVILDLALPDGSGETVIGKISDTPILVYSAIDNIDKSVTIKVDKVLSKYATTNEDIIASVQDLLSDSGMNGR